MGDIADYYTDLAMEQELEEDFSYERFVADVLNFMEDEYIIRKKLHWTTKEGEKIIVQNMESTHLINSIRWLENKKSNKPKIVAKWIEIFKMELQKR